METTLKTARLVIFDCDGVLVDSEPLAARAYVDTYARHGLAITADHVAQCVGMKQADIFARILSLTGHEFPQEHAADLWTETKRLFTQELKPTPGITGFLQALSTDRCVASSSSMERIAHSLDITGISPVFGSSVYSSSMVKNGKPAPDLFLHAAREKGFDPADCVVIEDSHFGVQGAIAAGMTAIGYTGGGHTFDGHEKRLRDSGAHEVFDSWTGIEAALRERGFIAA